MLGEEVEVLTNDFKNAGTYEVIWNASNFSNGIYLYKLESGNMVLAKKMILIK
jgi:hypothetical protein